MNRIGHRFVAILLSTSMTASSSALAFSVLLTPERYSPHPCCEFQVQVLSERAASDHRAEQLPVPWEKIVQTLSELPVEQKPSWKKKRDYIAFQNPALGRAYDPELELDVLQDELRHAVNRGTIAELPALKDGIGLVLGFGDRPSELVSLLTRFSLHRVEGVEWVGSRVEKARQWRRQSNLSGKQFLFHNADAEHLEDVIPDDSVNILYGTGFPLGCLTQALAEQIVRVLAPGGIAYFHKLGTPVEPYLSKHGKALRTDGMTLFVKVDRKKHPESDRGAWDWSPREQLQEIDRAILENNRLERLEDSAKVYNGSPVIPVVIGFQPEDRDKTPHYLRVGPVILVDANLTIPMTLSSDIQKWLLRVPLESLFLGVAAVPIIAAMLQEDLRGQIIEDDGIGEGLLSLIALKLGGARRVVGIEYDENKLRVAEHLLTEAGFTGRRLPDKYWRYSKAREQDRFILIHDDLKRWFGTWTVLKERIAGGRFGLRLASMGPDYKQIHYSLVQFVARRFHAFRSILGGYFEDRPETSNYTLRASFPFMQKTAWRFTESTFLAVSALTLTPRGFTLPPPHQIWNPIHAVSQSA
jgi:SAM-dependent methyltransferase